MIGVWLFVHLTEGFQVGVVWGGFGGAFGGGEHVVHACGAFGDEVCDERGFGEIFPILLGHL